MKKIPLIFAVFLAVIGNCMLTGCGNDAIEPCISHTWNQGVVTTEPTCGDVGIKTYECTVCKSKKEEYIAATGYHNSDNGVCSSCGYIDMSDLAADDAIVEYGYYHKDRDGSNSVNTDDYIYFGSYPQSKVDDVMLISELNTALAPNDWVSYDYIAGNAVNDYAKYQDVVLNGKKYRAVMYSEYRPYYTDLSASSANTYLLQNGYSLNIAYWFEYEPIKWRVLFYKSGEAILHSLDCIDAQSYAGVYNKTGAYYYADNTEHYSNEWEFSYIRSFLNGSFYNSSFSESERALINKVSLDNKSTGPNAAYSTNETQKTTQDKVYLLSYCDILNENYNFGDSTSDANNDKVNGKIALCKTGTEYAMCQGLRTSSETFNENGDACCWWLLRSAGKSYYAVCGVNKYGGLTEGRSGAHNTNYAADGDAFYSCEGIAPAVNIKLF